MIKMIDLFLALAHDHVDNYVIPGLRSSMIKDLGGRGKVRLFQMQRTQLMDITPHSHRYDLQCFVLRGSVENTTWTPVRNNSDDAREFEPFMVTEQRYSGSSKDLGAYITVEKGEALFEPRLDVYIEGEEYKIESHEIHNIRFAKDSVVLVFESETRMPESKHIEPIVQADVVRMFKVEEWMFRRSAK